uniref:Ataxin 7 like 2 n=1 Tax=Aquila chrysaetos chrysaetos TaxID=223781 RepID=A0A663EKK8_AQUCH
MAAAAAAERRLPSLDEFAGQSWSAWVERAGPPAEPGSELEESGKSSGKKLDAMTLIKEDMNIFGHCPAHDEFYLVVCNHCSQVVKPQAFQKHCERRHGPLSKLYARAAAAKCHVAVNGQPAAGGTPGAAKVLREKPPGARGRVQPLPERPDKDNNLWTRAPPSRPPGPTRSWRHLFPPPPQYSSGLRPPPASRCLPLPAGKECDLNRQCGVLNPDTKKICTRLLTCKIHSVHQRREVQGRAKDFDVLVAELKASSRKGESPKERSPPGKEPLPPSQQDPSSLPQPPAGPPSTSPCRAGSRVSSEESEEEGGEEPPPLPSAHPPFCTFGSRLVSPGCYVFNRRLDRFCSALGSMLERHLSSHMWRKIPPAAEPPLHTPPAPPQPYHPSLRPSRLDPLTPHTDLIGRVPASLNYTVGSPHAAAACSQPECGGGRQPVHHLPAAGQHPLALLQQVAFHQGQQIFPSPGSGRRDGSGYPQTEAPSGRWWPPL